MAVIAIVEDNPNTCRLLERLFRHLGHVPICMFKAEGVVELLPEMEPDLLVLDVNLPGLSGIDLLRTVKSEPALDYLPVVILSAVPDAATQAQALQLGAVDYIVKGCDWQTMLKRIVQWLPQRC